MILNILKYIKTLIVDLIYYFTSIPEYIRGIHTDIRVFIHDQKIKFQDILSTNIALGKHHLFRGRISDALFRFRMAHILFDTHNKEVNYWLGWCYFFKSNYETAIAYLEDSKEYDKYNLLHFIKDCKTIDTVPENLWNIMQAIRISSREDNYYYSANKYSTNDSTFINLPSEFTKLCMNNLENIEDNTEILDYGCNVGVVGSMLDHTISSKYNISAIETIEMFADYAEHITGDRGRVYDHITLASLHDTHKTLKAKKYDLITSFDSLIFTKDLSGHFKSFHKSLSKDGHLAILLPLATNTEWSDRNKSFIYSESDLENQLKLAEFNIVDIKKWKLSAEKSFIAFICTK